MKQRKGRHFSLESPGLVSAPSSWCLHASHAHHLTSSPCLVSSQAGLIMQLPSTARPLAPVCIARCRLTFLAPGQTCLFPPRLHRQLIYIYGSLTSQPNYLLLSANGCRQLLILLLKHLPPSPLPHSQLLVVLPCHNPSPSYIILAVYALARRCLRCG